VGLDHEFPAEKKDDPLGKIPSIVSIVPSNDPDAKGMDLNLTGPKIRVELSKSNFETYMELRKDPGLHPVLSATVIIPALVDVIDTIRHASEDGQTNVYADRRWYIVVARRLRELNVDPDDSSSFTDSSLKIAQDLLGSPVSASLEALKALTEEESD
jgi:hypothetical protein